MYGKLFESMYVGTLYGHWQAIITLQQMVIIADEDGVVDMTPPAIAAKTSIPLEIIEKGIEFLSQEDKYSRSDTENGKRIILIDDSRPWGWVIVNYKHYRDLASREDKKRKDRERIALKRSNTNGVAKSRKESQKIANVAHTNTNTNTKQKKGQNKFDQFWLVYPKKVKKKTAKEIWKRKKLDGKVDELVTDVELRLENDKRWKEGYIPDPTTYLNQERWEDECALS